VWTPHRRARGCDLKAVPGIGAEVVLTLNGELRKTRLFRSHQQAELAGAIADTRAMWRERVGLRATYRCYPSATPRTPRA